MTDSPAMIYPGRAGYQTPDKARRYAKRSSRRNQQEIKLVSSLMGPFWQCLGERVPLVLDVPSGTGRMARFLRERGARVVETDISLQMLMEGFSQSTGNADSVVGDLLGQLPFKTDAFDLVLCWRLIQHLPSSDSLSRAFGELARVSRKWVIVSFFHPFSIHNFTRRFREGVSGRKGVRFSHSLRMMKTLGEEQGLVMQQHRAQAPFLRDLWAVAYAKKEKG